MTKKLCLLFLHNFSGLTVDRRESVEGILQQLHGDGNQTKRGTFQIVPELLHMIISTNSVHLERMFKLTPELDEVIIRESCKLGVLDVRCLCFGQTVETPRAVLMLQLANDSL